MLPHSSTSSNPNPSAPTPPARPAPSLHPLASTVNTPRAAGNSSPVASAVTTAPGPHISHAGLAQTRLARCGVLLRSAPALIPARGVALIDAATASRAQEPHGSPAGALCGPAARAPSAARVVECSGKQPGTPPLERPRALLQVPPPAALPPPWLARLPEPPRPPCRPVYALSAVARESPPARWRPGVWRFPALCFSNPLAGSAPLLLNTIAQHLRCFHSLQSSGPVRMPPLRRASSKTGLLIVLQGLFRCGLDEFAR